MYTECIHSHRYVALSCLPSVMCCFVSKERLPWFQSPGRVILLLFRIPYDGIFSVWQQGQYFRSDLLWASIVCNNFRDDMTWSVWRRPIKVLSCSLAGDFFFQWDFASVCWTVDQEIYKALSCFQDAIQEIHQNGPWLRRLHFHNTFETVYLELCYVLFGVLFKSVQNH